MPLLIWTENAKGDVQRLYRFLAKHNVAAAQRAIQAIRTQVRIVAANPNMGRPVANMSEEYREWLIDFGDSGYVARYRLDRNIPVILAVWHQREAGF
jgi:plasmid stabilization system protein ParE